MVRDRKRPRIVKDIRTTLAGRTVDGVWYSGPSRDWSRPDGHIVRGNVVGLWNSHIMERLV